MEKRNHSPKREAILQAVQQSEAHPTADMVLQMVRNQYPSISQGTVYRNLRILAQEGRIRVVHSADGVDHFDGDTEPHIHITCMHCGKIVDYPQTAFEEPLQKISQETGFWIDRGRIELYGCCQACRPSDINASR